jgi:hypothetical protein
MSRRFYLKNRGHHKDNEHSCENQSNRFDRPSGLEKHIETGPLFQQVDGPIFISSRPKMQAEGMKFRSSLHSTEGPVIMTRDHRYLTAA